MANFCIGWRNHVMSGPVVVSGSASPDLDGTQLQNDQGNAAAAWQTPAGVTSGAVLLTRPAGTRWRMFGLFRTNLTAAATVDWFVIAGGGGVMSARSLPVQAGYGQAVFVAPTEVVGDTMQVNISDPTNPDGFLSIAQMFAGPGWQGRRNYSYQSAPGRDDSAAVSQTRAGGVIQRTDWIRRTFDLSLAGVDASEVRPQLMELDLAARRGGNVLFVPNPDSSDVQAEALFGQCKPQSGIGYPYTTGQVRSWRATLTERL